MNIQRQIGPNEPMMVAWTEYKKTEDYANSLKWAKTGPDYVEGSLWNVFINGFKMATERAAQLHEDINPASDDERHHHVPGAGAMGAVIQYRDEIRRLIADPGVGGKA